MVFNSSEKEQGKNSYNVRLPQLYITLLFRSLPGSTQLDRFAIARLTHELVSLWWNFFGTRWLAAVGNPTKKKEGEKGHLRTHSVCGGFVGVVRGGLGSRQKKKAETSSPKHHIGLLCRSIYAVSPTCWRSHMKSALTGRCHTNDGAQMAVQQKRLSDLPAASRLWTNGTPRQSTEWRPRDRKWFNHSSSALEKSRKQWRQEELSFFFRGERWATARCRFRRTRKSRNTKVQDSGHSGDLPLDIGASAMSLPGFFFSERPRFVELPQARERVSTATGQPARQTAVDLGVQRREHGQ